MTDFDIQTTPGDVWEELNNFNADYFDSQLTLENNMEKKYIRLTLPANEEEKTSELMLKIKFFDLQPPEEGDDEQEEDDFEEPRRLRVRFIKKRGDLRKWYEIFGEMQETVFDDLLLAPRLHQEGEYLTAASDEQISN